MRDFVIDRRGTPEPLWKRRPLAEDEAVFVVEDRAGMFHAAEGEGGREDDVGTQLFTNYVQPLGAATRAPAP